MSKVDFTDFYFKVNSKYIYVYSRVFLEVLADDFHWSLNDGKFSLLSQSLLNVLANLKRAMV